MSSIKSFISVLIICALVAAGIVYAISDSSLNQVFSQNTEKQTQKSTSKESEVIIEITETVTEAETDLYKEALTESENDIYTEPAVEAQEDIYTEPDAEVQEEYYVESAGIHSYTTLPTEYGEDSMTNCMLACQFYNGRVLSSGSTLDFIGTLSREGGYSGMVYAPIIAGPDGNGYGLGGGICAAAVAAGNAADGTEIIAQGTEHTVRSIYVRDWDIDYTVSEGEVELYITNKTRYDYVLSMWMNDDGSVSASYSPLYD